MFVTLLSYEMMMRCWEKRPVDRPTFQDLNRDISAYVEQLAGYLELIIAHQEDDGFSVVDEQEDDVAHTTM